MKFVFPLTKEDGSEFKDQNELETLLQHEKIGQFGFNPNNSSWHGGIHFTDPNTPWLKSDRPVRAIADGTVVACRVGKEYQTSEFMGEELQFSNDFCLIQHSVPNPDDNNVTFTFYSLYMHLAPLCAPHREVSTNARYELTKNRNIRLEAGLSANEVVLRTSSVIEATNDAAVTADGYIFKTFTVINNQNNTDTIAAEGNTIWLATHKEKQPVDISDSFLTDSSYTTYDTENSDFDMSVIPCVQTTQRWRARASSDMSKVAHTLAVESKLLRLENIEPVRSDKYLMAAYEIIDSKGERSTNVDLSAGSTIWLAVSEYPEPTELFSAFTKTYAIPSWLYTEVEGRVKVDKLSGRSDPTSKNGELNAGEKICTLTKGTRVKYSKVKDSSMQFIGSTERHMARCSFPDNDVKDDNGQSIRAAWVCIEDNLVEVIRPKTVELSSDGAHKVNSFGGRSKLTVKAGDPIGYLGRFDAAQLGQNKPYKSRYQVHFEVFSTEQPPQFFIDMFFGQTSNTEPASADATQANNDDTVQFKIVEDSFESDGFLDQDEPSEFFQLLFKKLTLGAEDVPGSDIIENLTDWDSCKYAITKHASEWAIKSGDKPFLDKLTEKYSNNDFKQLIEHEKSRIDNLIWMPSTQTQSNTKQVWNWWPISEKCNNFSITCDPSNFFYNEILAHEGGFVDHPDDPGGATNKGVILETWRKWSQQLFGIVPSVESLRDITDEQAYMIFIEGYWKKSLASEIKHCEFAYQFVDFYYNAPSGSAVVLQRTVNSLIEGNKVKEDWNMGQVTLNTVNSLIESGKEKELYTTYREKRIEYYNDRADRIPGASSFRNGWIKRAKSFNYY